MSKLLAVAQGVAAALLIQVGVVALRGDGRERPTPLLDEGAGRILEVEVHYAPAAGFVRETYDDFFRALGSDVRVYAAVERREHADELARRLGREVVPVVIGRPITTWARDRFAACDGAVVAPSETQPGSAERGNDAFVPFALAGVADLRARTAPFRFDGGDFAAVGGRVIASRVWAARNPDKRPEELVRAAERLFGMPVVYLPDAPDHHVGMAFAPAGPGTVVVGDARWGMRLCPEGLDADTSEETARQFDGMADGLARAGFRVRRIPVVPTKREFVWVTYTNGLFEDGRVYMPVYGFDRLDAAAGQVYRDLGLEVRPVRVAGTYLYGGTLHCLVHVVRRG